MLFLIVNPVLGAQSAPERKAMTDYQIPQSLIEQIGRDEANRIRRRHLDHNAHIAAIKGMTKAKCRELYDQMVEAIETFVDALWALRKCTYTGVDEKGRVKVEQRARITSSKMPGSDDQFWEAQDPGLFLIYAAEAIEQTIED
jgi:hypothetical protein